MPALRLVKCVLVATVGAWAGLVAYGNLADYDANWAFVHHVLAMDTVFPDNPLKSRAITDPAWQRGAYAAIIAVEFAMALGPAGEIIRVGQVLASFGDAGERTSGSPKPEAGSPEGEF